MTGSRTAILITSKSAQAVLFLDGTRYVYIALPRGRLLTAWPLNLYSAIHGGREIDQDPYRGE